MRRRFLAASAAALTSLLLPRLPQAGPARRLALRHAATGARFDGPWHDGRMPDPGAMAELSAVLADPGATPPLAFDPTTIGIVWQVATQAGLVGPLEIRSGYRTPQINRRAHGAGDSLHLRASAVDLSIPVGRMAAATEAALKLGRGGVGVYRGRSFIHLDSGAVRHWSDGATGNAEPREQRVARIAAEWRGTLRVEQF
jgi:uncharacterized protein YcbK (DUF882 family)